MSKKIKITESQLKTIMERKHSYQETNEEEVTDMDQLEDNDQEEVDVKEPEDIKEQHEGEDDGMDMRVTMAIFSHLSDLLHDSPETRRIRTNFIKSLVKKYIPKDVEINTSKLDALWDAVSQGDFSGKALDDVSEEPTGDMPGFEGTMDGLDSLSIREDDEMMNESFKKIKSNFKRFL